MRARNEASELHVLLPIKMAEVVNEFTTSWLMDRRSICHVVYEQPKE